MNMIWNRDGFITVALPFNFCLFINNKKEKQIFLTPVILIQDYGPEYQGSIGITWINFGIMFIYRKKLSPGIHPDIKVM